MDSDIGELLQFLTPKSRADLKEVALDHLKGLTVTPEGRIFFCKHHEFVEALIDLTCDLSSSIAHDAFIGLVNLSGDDVLAEKLVSTNDCQLVKLIFNTILSEPRSNHVEISCKLLNNLTRQINCCHQIYEVMQKMKYDIEKLIKLFTQRTNQQDYHHLAGVFCNITHLPEIRKKLVKMENNLFQSLIPFTEFLESDIRREGIVGMIRNCCFDTELHELLLSDDLDLLIYLLLPLSGPEEFDEEDMASLPLELQYLGEDKKRDPNPKVRRMLLEALTQLCATKRGRDVLRGKNAYLILRELHKWERVASVKIICENVVQILISDEPDPEMSNLKEVDIPNDLVEKFQKMDALDLKEIEDEESANVEKNN